MGALDLFFHLLSFAAPAFAVALLVVLAGRIFFTRRSTARAWWVEVAINSIAGVAALAAGLWYFGVDGKMATYAVLVAAAATCQWLRSGAWRA